MNPTDFGQLKGKVARNVYAILKFELMETTTLLSKAQEKDMAEYIYSSIQTVNTQMKDVFKKSHVTPVDRKPEKRGRKKDAKKMITSNLLKIRKKEYTIF